LSAPVVQTCALSTPSAHSPCRQKGTATAFQLPSTGPASPMGPRHSATSGARHDLRNRSSRGLARKRRCRTGAGPSHQPRFDPAMIDPIPARCQRCNNPSPANKGAAAQPQHRQSAQGQLPPHAASAARCRIARRHATDMLERHVHHHQCADPAAAKASSSGGLSVSQGSVFLESSQQHDHEQGEQQAQALFE